MKSLEEKNSQFEELGVIAFGLSIDHAYTKKAWAESLGIEKTPLLCDFWPHGDVAKKFDCFIEKAGISGRVNIIIDEEGKIKHYKVYDIPQLPPIDDILELCKD
jgi:peroxiredoxin